MKRIVVLIIIGFCFSKTEVFSQNVSAFFDEADAFFASYVSDGKVDYQALHANPEKLNLLLEKVKSVSVSTSEVNSYKAFWINAYNLAVIKGIVDNYPISSPLDKDGFFDTVKYNLGGISITLNDIENKMLRAKFNEPRFHFVLVCGAKGCPPLISKAYRPDTLETSLQTQTIKALNNSSFIKVTANSVELSEIFKWYKTDFVANGNSEIDFLNAYRKQKISSDVKVTYYSYDWRLNSK